MLLFFFGGGGSYNYYNEDISGEKVILLVQKAGCTAFLHIYKDSSFQTLLNSISHN